MPLVTLCKILSEQISNQIENFDLRCDRYLICQFIEDEIGKKGFKYHKIIIIEDKRRSCVERHPKILVEVRVHV